MCLKFILMLVFITSIYKFREVHSQDSCSVKKPSWNPLKALKTCLFKGYNPQSIPLQGEDKMIDVDLSFSLEDISFNDMSSEATFYLVMDMNWTDPFLKWDPKDYGNISKIILTQNEASKIWSPSLNSAYTYRFGGRKNTDDLFQVSKLEVNSEGRVIFNDLISMNSICEGDVTDFPFDKYECRSTIMSDNYENEVVFHNMGKSSNSSTLNMSLFTKKHLEVENGRVIIDVSKRVLEPGKEMVFTLVHLSINMARKTGTHILVFHLPAIGFCLLLILPLWIVPDSLARFFYPLVVMFGSIYQIDLITGLIKIASSYYSQPIHLVSFYRDLMLLSLVVFVESMLSSLLWKRKPIHEAIQKLHERISSYQIVNSLLEHTLFEKAEAEALQGTKQERNVEFDGPDLKSLAKLIDRTVFFCLLLVEVGLYWKLVP